MAASRALRDFEPFCHLQPEHLTRLEEAAIIRKFPAHFHVFNQNDPFTGYLYLIREGTVEITLLTTGGEELVVDYRREGQHFGCTPIFSGEAYTGGARTARETECFLLPQQVIIAVCDAEPQLRQYFNNAIVARVRHLYADIVASHSQKALGRLEAYPFQKRLSEIMTAPVITCNENASARDVARQMHDHHIRSLVITDADGAMVGLVTCRDLISRVLSQSVDAEQISARTLMSHKPLALPPSTYMYEAMAFMIGHRIKHLPVVEAGHLLGMVTMTDLVRHRSQKALLMLGRIEEAQDLASLRELHDTLVQVADSLLSETRSAPEVMETLSYIHHGLIRRCFDLCRQQLAAEGQQEPDIRYCFLIMGSGGRREMLLGPDQDNGFIYEDFPDERQAEVDAYFIPLAQRITQALDFIGYPLCEGDVMVSNAAWRGRLHDWRQRIADWAANPEPHKVRYSSIFFDFTPLAGDASLAHSLQSIVFQAVREHPGFLYHVMQLNLTHRVPLGLWGRFITEKSGPNAGSLSLKKGGLIYIVDCVRMFALEHEVRALTTLERLKALTRDQVFSADTAEHIRVAFEALSFLRLRNEISLLREGEKPSSTIDPTSLSRTEQDLLRSAFQAVSKLQNATRSHFGKGLS
ncbi:putative nucleotidyltransferase substrate binding domain-containing protein [Desulfuromonas thiophila]|uniref:CBS domain-containing protein n=1 Tax=Desulfuromonas thiophila TaxID=57664 RepID=A0A1G6YDR2_9BACT|nr:putative nucleotidyltransferase substrate binding domain-containing protein [Desulfuromonas thiophila]SDD88510.1 CBS domain-containing protein [Desulfuromonas thiophila]